jgi:hypothetical protein
LASPGGVKPSPLLASPGGVQPAAAPLGAAEAMEVAKVITATVKIAFFHMMILLYLFDKSLVFLLGITIYQLNMTF